MGFIFILIAKIIMLLCTNDFKQLNNECKIIKDKLEKHFFKNENKNKDNTSIYGYLIIICICNAVENLIHHLKNGDFNETTEGKKWIEHALTLISENPDSEFNILIEAFGRAYYCLEKLSIWNLRVQLDVNKNYRKIAQKPVRPL